MGKVVYILIPDGLKKPMGGMGEQAREILGAYTGDHRFIVIGSAKSEQYTEDNISFYPVMSMSAMSAAPDPLGSTFLNQSLFIERALRGDLPAPDIVHAFDWSTFYAGRILAKTFGVPLIVTIQLSIANMIDTPHPMQVANYNIACSLETSGLVDSSVIIQVSNSYAKLFPKIFRSKSTVIENGIDLEPWDARVSNRSTPYALPGDRPKKVVYIGRFAPMKNVLAILEAKLPDDIDLIFIGGSAGGDADIQDAVVSAAKDRDQVHYMGPKYGDNKLDALLDADALIMPSVHEPFGIVALEALASRSVLLSSFVGGMADFLTEEAAINCGTSAESITKALQDFSTMGKDERAARIDKGLEICKEYTWVKQATKLEKVYNYALNINANNQDKEN